jgi:hypothetical protein
MPCGESGRKKIKNLRTDNDEAYINNVFHSYLKANGIICQTIVPYSPEENAVYNELQEHR